MLLAIGLCGSFRIADGACLAAGPGSEVYESAMSQDSDKRHLAAIDVEREREMDYDGLHFKNIKTCSINDRIAFAHTCFPHTLTHTHTCVYISIYIYCTH